ncbi:MAG: response regulator [bacterium]|nr:response regulator [bacterium]
MINKILVVDDEPDFCEALGDFLGAKGYSVLEAHDGDQALEVYRQERPDVVLLDIRMPGKDGLETLRELRAFDPEAKVIMITAVPEEELDEQSTAEVEDGTLDYITKPFDPHSLERTLSILKRMELLSGDE